MEPISSDAEVHMALTPLQPVVFFGFHKRMSVTGLFCSKVTIHRMVNHLEVFAAQLILFAFSCYLGSWEEVF